MSFRVVEKDGNVWMCFGDRVLMYISPSGSLYVPGDVCLCLGNTMNIPPLPVDM